MDTHSIENLSGGMGMSGRDDKDLHQETRLSAGAITDDDELASNLRHVVGSSEIDVGDMIRCLDLGGSCTKDLRRLGVGGEGGGRRRVRRVLRWNTG